MEQIEKLIRVRRVEVVDGLAVRIEFEDSTVKLLDLEPLMHGPIFDELVHDSALFNQITVEHGTITWPNGATSSVGTGRALVPAARTRRASAQFAQS